MAEEEKKWLKTRIVVELLGKPLEHMQNTILLLGENFCNNLPEVKVTKRSVRPPVAVENTELFSAFVEFEADVKELATLIGIIFDYLPSSVEIIEPEEISDLTFNINGLLNDLALKMHQYDHIVKQLKAQNELQRRLVAKAKKKLDALKVNTDDLELPGEPNS
jgi:hypothetical protein